MCAIPNRSTAVDHAVRFQADAFTQHHLVTHNRIWTNITTLTQARARSNHGRGMNGIARVSVGCGRHEAKTSYEQKNKMGAWRELQSRLALGHDAHDVGICSELTVNFCLAAHPLHAGAYSQCGDFKN